MLIFLSSNRLCMLIDADTEAKRASEGANPEAVASEQQMTAYQQPLSWVSPGETWVEATSIFALSEQP